MSISREEMEQSNLFVGNIPADTLQNISNMLGFFQDFSASTQKMELSKEGTVGFYIINGCMKAALNFEIENR